MCGLIEFSSANLLSKKTSTWYKSKKKSPFFGSLKKMFLFLWPHLWHVEVPSLGAKSEVQLPAYTIVTAT